MEKQKKVDNLEDLDLKKLSYDPKFHPKLCWKLEPMDLWLEDLDLKKLSYDPKFHPKLLRRFRPPLRCMSYNPAAACPSAASIPADLISKGCEPLPRRRCLTRAPKPYPLLPFPQSLWPPSAAGLDCQMWVKVGRKNDFLIDEILSLSRTGGIRIGLDFDGDSDDFAARMAERNVTVVTSALAGHELVAARGLFPSRNRL